MKTLFTTDYKNYEPEWPRSARPSARAIILIDNIDIGMDDNYIDITAEILAKLTTILDLFVLVSTDNL